MNFNLEKREVTFCIGDFPSDVATALQSCLDINGFISNENKFRDIAAENIQKLFNTAPKTIKKLQTIVRGGNLLNIERDREQNQFGLDFDRNKYIFSLDVVPGQPDMQKKGIKTLAIIAIENNQFYLTAYSDEDGNYRYAGKVPTGFVADNTGTVWVNPQKFKKVRVAHSSLQYSMQDVFSVANDKVIKIGTKLSAVISSPEIIQLTDDSAPLSQLTSSINEEAKILSFKEIQRIGKDEAWEKLREEMRWDSGSVQSSLTKLGKYLADNPSRQKNVRVFNLLNSVSREDATAAQIRRMHQDLQKQLGGAIKKEAAKFKPGDKVTFINLPTVPATPPPGVSKEQNEYDRTFVNELKTAGTGTVVAVSSDNVWGVTYEVALTPTIPGDDSRPPIIAKEDNLAPALPLTKIPVTKPLSEKEKEEFIRQIGEVEKTDPEKAKYLLNKLFALTKKSKINNTPLGAAELTAAFMPTLPMQPFWDQHNDGGGTGDYKYPVETLYPPADDESVEGSDASKAYTRLWDKINPNRLLHMLKKMKKPLSKDEAEQVGRTEGMTKQAILDMDPDIAARFYIPSLTLTIDTPENISGEYEATRIGNKPSSTDRLKGVDPEQAKVHPVNKSPAEKMQEGKTPTIPIPQEGDRAPIFFLPGVGKSNRGANDKPFKPLTTSSEAVYQVRYVKGPNCIPGTVVGYFDASDFLSTAVKKGQERKGLADWLSGRITAKAVEISKLFRRNQPDTDVKTRLSWESRLLQSAISEDWDQAFKDLQSSGKENPALHKAIVSGLYKTLLRERRFKELSEAIAKYKLLPASWSNQDVAKLKEQVNILAGKLSKPASSDYAAQANLVLDGNEMFPTGGSIEAKRKVLRDADVERVQEYILSDKFKQEPYAVQSAAVRRLETAGTSGEEGLFAVWKTKDLPASLRKEALNTLVLAYGVGKESRGYSSSGRFKATKNLLTEAAEDADADIRALAYTLMIDPSVDFLPWTNKGEFVFNPQKAKGRRDQPAEDIPEWMLVQLANEPYSELRDIVYEIVDKLPKKLVVEETAPVLDNNLKIITPGKYTFSEEVLPGVRKLIIIGLQDADPRVRAKMRAHFGLPREIELKKEKPETKVMQPSAKDYIFHAKVALNQDNLENAEGQLTLATQARDAADFKEEIDSLKKKIVEVRQNLKDVEEKEVRITKLQETLVSTHADLKEVSKLTEFLNWASQLKYQTTFESLSVKNKEELLSLLVKDIRWYAQYATQKTTKNSLPLPEKEEDIDETSFEKEGALPLGSIELESRQPPTTWPLSNPQVGYSSAVPLGDRDDNLLLKDVRQFYGRPEGKWRSLLNTIYKIIFKDKEEQDVEELGDPKQMVHKEAAADPSSREEALKMLSGEDAEAFKAIEFLGASKDVEGLQHAIREFKNEKKGLQKILSVATANQLSEVIEQLLKLPAATGIQEEALRSLFDLKDAQALGRALYTPWHPLAIKYLIDLGYTNQLKDIYRATHKRPVLQRNIVLNLGDLGDTEFMTEALANSNEEVRKQAIEWLTHHKRFDILKQHIKKEKDPAAKAAIEKYLAMAKEGPTFAVLDQLNSEEQTRKIEELAKTAQDAFTVWDKYPEIRREVLGEHGRRYGISSFNEWKTVQAELDNEIKERMSEYPSMEEGREALRDLEKIAQKLPDATKQIATLRAWIDEAKEKYEINKQRPSNVSDEQWESIEKDLSAFKERIDVAQKNLDRASAAVKGDLEFRIAQLQLLERNAMWRSSLADAIKHDDAFKKEYGSGGNTWQTYQAYLKTYDKDIQGFKELPKTAVEGLADLEKSREEMAWKFTEPLRKRFSEEQEESQKAAQKLLPFYKRLQVEVDSEGNPIAPGVKELNDSITQYKKLEDQWFKLSGTIEPYADIDGEKYRVTPAAWILMGDSSALPEYSRGKRLTPMDVSKFHSPWSDLISEAEKKKVEVTNDFLKKLNNQLPPEGKELLLRAVDHEKKAGSTLERLRAAGISLSNGKLKYINRGEQLETAKEKYDKARKDLLERLKSMDKLKESDSIEDKKQYILLKKELADFRNQYGVPPIPDTPDANLKKQYFYDRWKSPGVRGPRAVPQVVAPAQEKAPYSGSSEFTEEQRKAVEEEIARRRKEYGAPKDEFGEDL